MRSTRRASARSACSLCSMDDQPDASTATTRVNLRCKRSLIARVSGASSNRSRSLPRSRPSRAQRVCVPQVRDPTLRTGREGGIEMLNIEGRAPARPWPACRSVTVKPSSKRSPDLYVESHYHLRSCDVYRFLRVVPPASVGDKGGCSRLAGNTERLH